MMNSLCPSTTLGRWTANPLRQSSWRRKSKYSPIWHRRRQQLFHQHQRHAYRFKHRLPLSILQRHKAATKESLDLESTRIINNLSNHHIDEIKCFDAHSAMLISTISEDILTLRNSIAPTRHWAYTTRTEYNGNL